MHKTVTYTKKEYQYKKKTFNYIWIVSIIIFFISLTVFAYTPPSHSAHPTSPLGTIAKVVFSTSTRKTIPQPQEQNSVLLGALVNHVITDVDGNYGIVVRNLRTRESYYYNAHQEFETASLYKLWIMATVYDDIKKGQIHTNDILSENVDTLDTIFNISSDSADLSSTTVSMSVADALNQMITVSDNNAALLLSERIRLATASKFLDQHGFFESKFGTDTNQGLPTTTAADIAVFFEKLYNGRLIDHATDNTMIDLLKQQKLTGKIPKYLPASTVIAHKTGELDPNSHDAGIIYTKSGNYILVVLSDSNSRLTADTQIAKISQAVYNYFSSDGVKSIK